MEMERGVGGERKKHLISQLIFRFKLPGPLVASGDFVCVSVCVCWFPWAPQREACRASQTRLEREGKYKIKMYFFIFFREKKSFFFLYSPWLETGY